MGYLKYDTVSEKLSINQGETQAIVKIHLPWLEAIKYAKESVGGWVMVGGVLLVQPPAQYDYDLGFDNQGIPINISLECINAEVENFGDYECSENGGGFKTAEVTLTFGRPQRREAQYEFDLTGEEFVIKKPHIYVPLTPGADVNQSANVAPANATEDYDDFIKIMPASNLTISWNLRPIGDPRNWRCAVGRVNDICWSGFAPETVLFLGCKTRTVITSNGQNSNETVFAFKINYAGWNNKYSAKLGKFVPYRVGGMLKDGTIKKRDSASKGDIQLQAGHGLTLPGNINVFWKGGQRLNCTPIYSGDVATISNGTGDNLPKLNTVVGVIKVGVDATLESKKLYTPISFNTHVMQESPAFIPALNPCNTVCIGDEGY